MDTSEDVKLIDAESGVKHRLKSDDANSYNDIQKPPIKSADTVTQIHTYFDALQIERYIRLFCNFIFIGGSLIIYWQLRTRSPYHNVAYCMFLVQLLWLIQFLGVVFTMDHLHSVVVLRKVLPDTLFLVVPYAVKEYKTIIMSSISAMSSMRGSNVFYLLGSSSNICFGMTFSVASFKWYEMQETDERYAIMTFAMLLILLSTFGSTIITGWELDLNSQLSTGLHYFGAFITFITAPTGFAMQQQWSGLSVGLMVWTYICLMVFGSVYAFANPEYDNNPVMVHRVSIFCIVVELVAVVNGMLCVILFIYCMEGDWIL